MCIFFLLLGTKRILHNLFNSQLTTNNYCDLRYFRQVSFFQKKLIFGYQCFFNVHHRTLSYEEAIASLWKWIYIIYFSPQIATYQKFQTSFHLCIPTAILDERQTFESSKMCVVNEREKFCSYLFSSIFIFEMPFFLG